MAALTMADPEFTKVVSDADKLREYEAGYLHETNGGQAKDNPHIHAVEPILFKCWSMGFVDSGNFKPMKTFIL